MIIQRVLPSFHYCSWPRHGMIAENQCLLKRCYASDPYRALNIKPGASKEEIKAAYVELSKKYHPDLNKDAGAGEKFMKIKEAAEMLLNKDSTNTSEHSRYSKDMMYKRRKFEEDLRRRQRIWQEEETIYKYGQQHDEFWRNYYQNRQHIDNAEFWRQYYKQRDEMYGATRHHFDAEKRRKEWKKFYDISQQKRQQHFADRNERIKKTMENYKNGRQNEAQANDKESVKYERFYTFYRDVKQEDYDRFFDENKKPKLNFFKYLIGFFGIQLLIFYILTVNHRTRSYSERRNIMNKQKKHDDSLNENQPNRSADPQSAER